MLGAMHMVVPKLVVAAMLTVPAAAQPVPRVTTDSPEYCSSLVARLGQMPGSRADTVRALVAEGLRLCGEGHVRVGVAKLRRAIRRALSE